MKCEFCEQEFSDAVYPLHIERCEKRVSPGTEAQTENEVNGNVEPLENESAGTVQGTESDVMENISDETEPNNTKEEKVETEQSAGTEAQTENSTAGKKKSKK